ncbi:MAG: hypothetical protein AB9835_01405 [Eubacteriales bacterium]
MNTVTTVILFLLALTPLAVSGLLRSGKGKKRALIVNIVSVAFVCVLIFGGSATSVLAQETETAVAGTALPPPVLERDLECSPLPLSQH